MKNKKDNVIIHELTYDEVERLELGIPIDIGNNHFVKSSDYVKKLARDEFEFSCIEEELNNEYKNIYE